MMPRLVAALALVLLGCSTQLDGIPSGSGVGSGGGNDGSTASDAATQGSTADLATGPSAPDLGAVGASCKTACDCEPGLACRRGKCSMSQMGMVYCCESSTCPQGELCQSQQGGMTKMCGG
jgi:hypothetical protein